MRDAKADPVDKASAIFCLGVDERYEFERDFESLLQHPHALVRGQAMHVLLGWGRVQHLDEALHAVLHDPDSRARGCQILGLALVGERSPEQAEPICRALVQVVRSDDESALDAYVAILRILGVPRGPNLEPARFDPERDIDWDLLAPYAEPPPGPN